MVKLLIDTREPRDTFRLLTKLKIPYKSQYLPVGDIATSKVVFERKTVPDLVSSIFGQKKEPGYRKKRFDPQLREMADYCDEHKMVGWLLVSGSVKEATRWFKRRKINLNAEAIYGALASATVRYGVNVVWNLKDDEHLLKVAYKIATKIDEGKLGVPRKLALRKIHQNKRVALISDVLRVSPRIATNLYNKFGGLGHIIQIVEREPRRLWIIDGIGDKTIDRIRKLLGFE